MEPESLIGALGRVYLWTIGGGCFLTLLAETFAPLDPVVSENERTRHVLRNLSLGVLTRVLAGTGVGVWLLAIDTRLFAPGWGLLSSLDLSVPALCAVGILAVDFGQYVFHRFAHRARWLWMFHAVHHSDAHLDMSTTFRFHAGETAANLIWTTALLEVLGLPLWVMAPQRLLMIPVALLQHGNFRQPRSVDLAMRWVIATSGLHKIHHSPLATENNSNFGEVFSFWDRIFGTLREASEEKSQPFGLVGLNDDRWQTLWGMLVTPLQARRSRLL